MSFDAILVLAIVLLIVAAATLGVYSYFRSPQPYLLVLRAVIRLLKIFWPHILAALVKMGKPYDPETQKRFDAVRRRGGVWDHRKRRERL